MKISAVIALTIAPQAMGLDGGLRTQPSFPSQHSFLQTSASEAAKPASGGVMPNGIPMPFYNPLGMPMNAMQQQQYMQPQQQYMPMSPNQPIPPQYHPYSQMINNGMTHMIPGMTPPPQQQQYYGAGQLPIPGTNPNNNTGGIGFPYMSPYMTHPGLIPTTTNSAYHPAVLGAAMGMYPAVAPSSTFPPLVAATTPTLAGSGMPHTAPLQHMDSSLPAVYDNFGYEPLNAKLAVPQALPSGVATAEQVHLAAYGDSSSSAASSSPSFSSQGVLRPTPGLDPSIHEGLSLSNTLSNTIAGQQINNNNNMAPVRLPNGMTMQVPRDELSSMTNAVPTYSLPALPTTEMPLSSEWRQKLATAQSSIAAQQAQYSQYSDAAYQSVAGKEQESEMLQSRLQALQKNLVDAKHATEMQKEWLDQVARRNAALEVDKHKVSFWGKKRKKRGGGGRKKNVFYFLVYYLCSSLYFCNSNDRVYELNVVSFFLSVCNSLHGESIFLYTDVFLLLIGASGSTVGWYNARVSKNSCQG